MAIEISMLLNMIVMIGIGLFAYLRLLPAFKGFIDELIPAGKVSTIIVQILGLFIILYTLELVIGYFLQSGIITGDAVKWLGFVSPGIGLMSDILGLLFSGIYYVALLFIGFAVLGKMGRANVAPAPQPQPVAQPVATV